MLLVLRESRSSDKSLAGAFDEDAENDSINTEDACATQSISPFILARLRRYLFTPYYGCSANHKYTLYSVDVPIVTIRQVTFMHVEYFAKNGFLGTTTVVVDRD